MIKLVTTCFRRFQIPNFSNAASKFILRHKKINYKTIFSTGQNKSGFRKIVKPCGEQLKRLDNSDFSIYFDKSPNHFVKYYSPMNIHGKTTFVYEFCVL